MPGFWRIHAYNIGGLVYNLDEIEHGVLRANKGEYIFVRYPVKQIFFVYRKIFCQATRPPASPSLKIPTHGIRWRCPASTRGSTSPSTAARGRVLRSASTPRTGRLCFIYRVLSCRNDLELETNHQRSFHNYGEGPY